MTIIILMKAFIQKPGSTKEELLAIPDEENPNEYPKLQYYIQYLLRKYPNDIDKLITCPDGIELNKWIFAQYCQFLEELNHFTWEHRDVCTSSTHPEMKFVINGQTLDCRSAATNPPSVVPAIDYMTQTLDMATSIIFEAKYFGETVTDGGIGLIKNFMRRLYRIFSYSFSVFPEIFDTLEAETHLCERFGKFAHLYSLIGEADIHVAPDYFEKFHAK